MVDCTATTELGAPDYMARFTERAIRDRVPASGSFDLTYRCNLRCTHCYCGHLNAQTRAQAGELETDVVLRILAEAADAGCLFMVLSGGEPLLRPDFPRIYAASRRLGMLTTVFTNATLVDERLLEVFREYPPRMVEISLYGVTPQTYERVSGVPGSFARAWKGIDALLEAGVRVGLKTMILRDNLDEIVAIEAKATELGLPFRLDAVVTPRLDGDTRPLEQRVDPDAAVALELATDKRRYDNASFRDQQSALPDSPDLYRCGAGVMGFHLDPQGVLRPCLMTQDLGSDAAGLGFAGAWNEVVEKLTGLRRNEDSVCVKCRWRVLCGYCPGLFALETGSPHGHSPYLCELGERRWQVIDEVCEMRRQ
jgi:radical SAM protein with 4Fe4S-binding SPASM domain